MKFLDFLPKYALFISDSENIVKDFEEKVAGREITKQGVLADFTYTLHDVKLDANIFKSETEKKAEEAEVFIKSTVKFLLCVVH